MSLSSLPSASPLASCFFSFANTLVSALPFLFNVEQAIGYCVKKLLHLGFRDGFLAFFAFGYTAITVIVVMDEIGRVRNLLYSHSDILPSVLKDDSPGVFPVARCSPRGGCLFEQLRGQNRAFELHLRIEQIAELIGNILAVTDDSCRLID